MEKYLKYLLIFIILIGLVGIINFFIKPINSDTITNYLLNMGFTEDVNDNTYLTKYLSSSTTNHFSVADFSYEQEIDETVSGVDSSLYQVYNFKNHSLIFNYRVTYSNNINVIYKGSYNNNSFVCEKEFSTATLDNESEKNTCSLVKLKVQRFYDEANVLFNNHKYIKYMEEN